MKLSFIAWIKYSRRSELLAECFGTSMHHISYGSRNKKWLVPIRYLVQSLQTLIALFKERPRVVFVQNPPILILLPVGLYCFLFRAKFIIDSHTGAFTDFKRTLWLHKLYSRFALVTIVHNRFQAEIVKEWNVPFTTLGFADNEYPKGSDYPVKDGFTVAFSCACAPDEPMLEVFGAAKMLPDVNFYITGDYTRLEKSVLDQKPENCQFTGFVSFDDYVGLLRKADAVMALTTRDETLLSGGFEAVSLERPFIVSDWTVLQEYFSMGSVYVDNKAAGIAAGVKQAMENQDQLEADMKRLRSKLNDEFEASSNHIKRLINDFAQSNQANVGGPVYSE